MDAHTTHIASHNNSYHAACDCGWEEDVRHIGGADPYGAAENAARAHQDEAAAAGDDS